MNPSEIPTRKEILETIERRFQFVIILALFLPFTWNIISTVLSPLALGLDYQVLLGSIITIIFMGYLVLEFTKKSIKDKSLDTIEMLLLVISYCLIVVIGCSTVYKISDITGWKIIALELGLLFSLFLPFFLLIIGLYSGMISFFTFIREQFKK